MPDSDPDCGASIVSLEAAHGAWRSAMARHTHTEHQPSIAVQLLADATQAVRRIRQPMQQQHSTAWVSLLQFESAVPVGLYLFRIRKAAAGKTVEGKLI
jgi:hypothetical protein